MAEDNEAPKRSEWGAQCVAYLREIYPNEKDLVEEYISEAENQDGYSCWDDLYGTLGQVTQDYELYKSQK